MKFVQATREAYSPQKSMVHPALKNMKFLHFFVGPFCAPGSRSGYSRPRSMQIRLASTILSYASPSAGYLNWKQPGDPPGPKGWRLRLVRLNRTRARCRPAQLTFTQGSL